MKPFIVYLAKPGYGGWVTFTAHLALKFNFNIYKMTDKGGKAVYDYGYGTKYQNISPEILAQLISEGGIPIISAIDHNYYKYLEYFPDETRIIIHDPTEFNLKKKKIVLENLPRFKVITIRKTVQEVLANEFDIESTFLLHPYVPMITPAPAKTGSISVSRIDHDKNIDIIVLANSLIANKQQRTEIYGKQNDIYHYHTLKKMPQYEIGYNEQYKGTFPKSEQAIQDLLAKKLYVVDCSTISKDGGGSQYTFLEALDAGCVLILNYHWVSALGSIWEDGVNCLVIGSDRKEIEQTIEGQKQIYKSQGKRFTKSVIDNIEKSFMARDLAELLVNPPPILDEIRSQSMAILDRHVQIDWLPVLLPPIKGGKKYK